MFVFREKKDIKLRGKKVEKDWGKFEYEET